MPDVILNEINLPEILYKTIKQILFSDELYVGIDDAMFNRIILALPLKRQAGKDYHIGERRVDSVMLIYYPLLIFVDYKSSRYDIRKEQHEGFLRYADILIYVVKDRAKVEEIGKKLSEINDLENLNRVIIYSEDDDKFYIVKVKNKKEHIRESKETPMSLLTQEKDIKILMEGIKRISEGWVKHVEKDEVYGEIITLDKIRVVD